jgi:hypothetical protein
MSWINFTEGPQAVFLVFHKKWQKTTGGPSVKLMELGQKTT